MAPALAPQGPLRGGTRRHRVRGHVDPDAARLPGLALRERGALPEAPELRRRDLRVRQPVHRLAREFLGPPSLPGARGGRGGGGEPALPRSRRLEEPVLARIPHHLHPRRRPRGRRPRRAGHRRGEARDPPAGRRALRRHVAERVRARRRALPGRRAGRDRGQQPPHPRRRALHGGHVLRHRREPGDRHRQLPPHLSEPSQEPDQPRPRARQPRRRSRGRAGPPAGAPARGRGPA